MLDTALASCEPGGECHGATYISVTYMTTIAAQVEGIKTILRSVNARSRIDVDCEVLLIDPLGVDGRPLSIVGPVVATDSSESGNDSDDKEKASDLGIVVTRLANTSEAITNKMIQLAIGLFELRLMTVSAIPMGKKRGTGGVTSHHHVTLLSKRDANHPAVITTSSTANAKPKETVIKWVQSKAEPRLKIQNWSKKLPCTCMHAISLADTESKAAKVVQVRHSL